MTGLDAHIDNLLADEGPEPKIESTEEQSSVEYEQTSVQPTYHPQPSGVVSSEGVRYRDANEYFNSDPLGYARDVAIAQQQQLNALQVRETEREAMAYTAKAAAEWMLDHPEHPAVVEGLFAQRVDELQAVGLSAKQAQAVAGQEANQLVMQAASTGRNPAELVYRLARARGIDAGKAIESMTDRQFEQMWSSVERTAKKNGYMPGIKAGR